MTTNIEQFLPKFPQQPLRQIWGLVLSNNNINPNTHIDVSVGACMDDKDKVRIDVNLTKSKELINPSANTIYNVFIIKNAGSDEVDIHFDTNKVSPTLPSGYNYKRWLGWIVTDSNGDIIEADWIGDDRVCEMWFKSRQTVATGLNQTSYTIQSLAGWIPAGVQCGALFGGMCANSIENLWLSSDGVNAKTIGNVHSSDVGIGGFNELYMASANGINTYVPVVNSQIYYKIYGIAAVTLLLRSVRYWR